ncbi:hypothetical protein BC832DRAFT_246803 [Gaertneriomyces semiglobifer]|nr:hypothetical protein BC832DRAFT_246803 [Gaertneriomyces semiglobifer]
MGLAMALEAQQRRVTELTKESLQEKAGDSDEEGESLFSITDPEASDEGNTETQPARLTQDPDQVNNMISGWLKEVPASSDGNEEAVEPNAAVPTPPRPRSRMGFCPAVKMWVRPSARLDQKYLQSSSHSPCCGMGSLMSVMAGTKNWKKCSLRRKSQKCTETLKKKSL